MTDRLEPPAGMLIVTIDRLPAWILPAYGCTWAATPVLDALAGRGLVLDRLMAAGDDPLATLASLAGRAPPAHDGWPLLEAAAARGWSPAVVTDDADFAARLPPDVVTRVVPAATEPRIAADATETNLGRLGAAAADLGARRDHRLIWLHATSLGHAWDAPLELREAYLDPDDPPPPPGAGVPRLEVTAETDPDEVAVLRQLFAGQLTLLDDCLGRLLESLDADDPQRRWSVFLAGVRGMPLGLHGTVGPLPLPPYGELVQLPALLVDHRARMAAQRYGGLLIPADCGATLVELLGDSPAGDDDHGRGRSLVPLLDEWRIEPRDRAVAVTSRGIAVVTPAWHLVLPSVGDGEGRPLLFTKPDDYFEACDVADRVPDVAEELARVARLAATDPSSAWAAPLSAAAQDPGGR